MFITAIKVHTALLTDRVVDLSSSLLSTACEKAMVLGGIGGGGREESGSYFK